MQCQLHLSFDTLDRGGQVSDATIGTASHSRFHSSIIIIVIIIIRMP